MSNLLSNLKANKEFENWATGKVWEEIFSNCPKGEWLLWLFQKSNPEDLRLISLTKGHCANTLRFFIENEKIRKTIDAAIDYGKGEISLSELTSFVKKASELAAICVSEESKIEQRYDNLDFNSESTFDSNYFDTAMDCKLKDQMFNSIFHYIALIGVNAVDINEPADNIAYHISECIYQIVNYEEPLELIDYTGEYNPYEPSKITSFKLMYSNYIRNTASTCITDTAETAKTKNQLITADICRKLLPIGIWNISYPPKQSFIFD